MCNDERELVSESKFTLWKKGIPTPSEVVILLFSDIILIGRQKKGSFQLLKPPIALEDAYFCEKSASKNMLQIWHINFEIYNLESFTQYDKYAWMQEAEAAQSRFTILNHQLERDLFSSGQGKRNSLYLKKQSEQQSSAKISDDNISAAGQVETTLTKSNSLRHVFSKLKKSSADNGDSGSNFSLDAGSDNRLSRHMRPLVPAHSQENQMPGRIASLSSSFSNFHIKDKFLARTLETKPFDSQIIEQSAQSMQSLKVQNASEKEEEDIDSLIARGSRLADDPQPAPARSMLSFMKKSSKKPS